ncbi:MAG TPA: hypothetical protein DIT67_01560 [Octadecabacter sp.]|nr:hypothetical protein [Octadecabacter sp.]
MNAHDLHHQVDANNRAVRTQRGAKTWAPIWALLVGAAIALAVFCGLTFLLNNAVASILAAHDLGELSQIAANGW